MKKILGTIIIILGFGIGGFIVQAGSVPAGAVVSIIGLVVGTMVKKSGKKKNSRKGKFKEEAEDCVLHNYVCPECGLIVQRDRMPAYTECPSTGGSHRWQEVGVVGPKTYQCGNCGIVINCKQFPPYTRCRCGGSHVWHEI